MKKIPYTTFYILVFLTILLDWEKWNIGNMTTVLPMIITCLVICSFTVFTTYEPAMKVNCLVNQSSREHVIELLNQGKLSQSDINEFELPLSHRLSSHMGSIWYSQMNRIQINTIRFYFIFIAVPVSVLRLYILQMMRYITVISAEIIAVSVKLIQNGIWLKWFGTPNE